MLDLVRQLQEERRLTVVMVSHNPQDALRIAGETAFIHDGRVLAAGPTRALLTAREPAELRAFRSEEHTSELQSLMRNSYAVFCLKKKKTITTNNTKCTNESS